MATYDEVLSFKQFDNNDAIEALVNMLPDKSLALNQLFKMACIQGHINAVKFIHKKAGKENIELDISTGLLLAAKNNNDEIIKYFISLGTDITFNDNQLLKKAIEYCSETIVYDLLISNQYKRNIIKEIYDFAFGAYSYRISTEIEKQWPEISRKSITEIDENLQVISQRYLTITSDKVDFLCSLIDRGGKISILNDSTLLLTLIANDEYESVAKLVLKGVDPTKMTMGTIAFLQNDYDMYEKEFKEEVFDPFQEYMDEQYPDLNLNCIPACMLQYNPTL